MVDAGHDVTAFYLKIWLEDELSFLGNCPWEDDLKHIQKTCKLLNVPLKIISLQQEYWDTVVAYTLDQARAGKTPNPDVLCNFKVKFDAFFTNIPSEFEKVATGHYASTRVENGKTQLVCSPDRVKDQTYFLAHLTQAQLSRLIFPLGSSDKNEVRHEAHNRKLPSAQRKDSYGICFLGKISFKEFLEHHLGTRTGELREFESDKVLGSHNGYWFYTIGQRKGIGLSGGPWFVVSKDINRNIVYISRSYYSPDKQRKEFEVEGLSWIATPPTNTNLSVKLRHGPSMHNATIHLLEHNRARVSLQEQDQGIAPGQFAVFYDGDTCLGCGTIAFPSQKPSDATTD
jgi:tRNA-specific 2-thiouridylase